MLKINAILFGAGLTTELEDEFTELGEIVDAAKQDLDKGILVQGSVDEVARVYCHLNSLIQGISIAIDYAEDGEEKEQFKDLIENYWKFNLETYWPRIMGLKYSLKIGEPVRILAFRHRGRPTTYEVNVGTREAVNCETSDDVREYLKSL